MKIENLEVGKEYKWRDLCGVLDIPYKSGSSKIKQVKEFESKVKFEKNGTKYKILEIYDTPKEIIETRGGANNHSNKYKSVGITKEESRYEYNGFYVYSISKNNEVLYIGKGCRRRVLSSMYQKFDKSEYDNLTLKIIKRFGDNEIEALDYEKEMIEYYQSIGQCKYNDSDYHIGNVLTKEIKLKTIKNNLLKEKEQLLQKLNNIDLQLQDIEDKLA